jgi:hypothetical protein
MEQENAFEHLINSLVASVGQFPDKRTGDNSQYPITDIGLGAFSVFFTQFPSFLSHQKIMEEMQGKSNAQTLFQIKNIPTPTHIRNVLDEVEPEYLYPVFAKGFELFKSRGQLEDFRIDLGGGQPQLLLALDGTQHFSSTKIQCQNCSTCTHNRKTTYSHKMINPAFVVPGNDKVIAIEPEFIKPQDGERKQDCETKAAKRWLNKHSDKYSPLGITFLGDDLYCHQPLCKEILKAGFNFILVCKPQSHKVLYEWLEMYEKCGDVHTVIKKKWNGSYSQIWEYKYASDLPLKDGDKAMKVNWCELTITREKTKEQIYKNAFATNHQINQENLTSIVAAGRARWKTENENNNTLKNKGYNLNHNYGHGEKHLSSLLATMNILAFLFHTLLEILSDGFQKLRQRLPTRKMFFEHIKTLLCYVCFEDWEYMMKWMIQGLDKGWKPTPQGLVPISG